MCIRDSYLWAFVELGFAGVLAIMLIYLILGENSGVFVQSVAENVTKFANAVPTPSLIGLGPVSYTHLGFHLKHVDTIFKRVFGA